jgi:preprotein translocase subunit SecE
VFGTYYQWLIHDARGQIVQFLRDVRSELRKVTFPSRKETLASTVVVLVVVFIIAVYLGLVDLGLSLVLSNILQ